ncbi:MAG: dipeptide epimerase [Planctomycetes bacterium]|nr:dipeptide epimerase [Planctomycetota bacterium]
MTAPWSLRVRPFTLELRHRFTIATSSRTTTPTLLVELERDGVIGFGEAAMPPYLGESHATAQAFLARIDLARYPDPFLTAAILADVDALAPGNPAAKAAFDIALHDWLGKVMRQPWHRVLGLDPRRAPPTSFTIGIHPPDVVQRIVAEAGARFASFKIKLGGEHDREMIRSIREVSSLPLRVDVNQGWRDRHAALQQIEWLATQGVELVEQPLPKENVDDLAWLCARSPLPIVGDAGVQRLADVPRAVGVYHGINVKLMKCTGLREARTMLELARALGLRSMLGCMTETSCAISAAAQLSPLADWTDLDGALLVANDPFVGATLVDGRIVPSASPGIGAAVRT